MNNVAVSLSLQICFESLLSFFLRIYPEVKLLDHIVNLAFPGGSDCKESTCNAEDLGSIPQSGRSLEKGMATHSRILAWRIPWTEEPVQSIGLQRVGHD